MSEEENVNVNEGGTPRVDGPDRDSGPTAVRECHEETAETLRDTISSKAFAVRTLNRRLQLVTGLAVAQTLTAAAFLALRGTHLSLTVASNISGSRLGGVVAVPTLVLWVTAVSLSIAWSFILVGAFSAHGVARIATLAVFSLSMSLLWLNGGFSGVSGALQGALVALMWVVGAVTWWRQRRGTLTPPSDAETDVAAGATSRATDRLPGVAGVALVTAGVFAIYLASWRTPGSRGGGSSSFASALFEQVAIMALLLIPALLLAGSEFGEWGLVVGEWIDRAGQKVGRSARIRQSLVLLVVALAISLRLVTSTSSRAVLFEQTGVGAVVAVVIGALLWFTRGRRLTWATTVPYFGLILAAVALYVVSSADLLARTSSAIIPSAKVLALGGDLVPYSQSSSPPFSIKYPSGWTVQKVPPDYTIFNGAGFGADFVVLRVHVPADQFTAVTGLPKNQAIEGIVTATLKNGFPNNPSLAFSSLFSRGKWLVQYFELSRAGAHRPFMEGAGWERQVGNHLWVLYGDVRSREAFNKSRAQLFQSMVNHWSPSASALPASDVVRASTGVPGTPYLALGFWLVAALLLGALLTRRQLHATHRVGVLLALLVAILFLAGGGHLGPAGDGFHGLHIPGVQLTVAMVSILIGAVVLVRRHQAPWQSSLLRNLLVLNVALQIAAWMYQLFGGALSLGGQFSIAQGLVVFAALIWELTFSGVTMTNRNSSAFPRHSRVLLYCGYIMLVATTVMFFSSLHIQATGSRLEPIFESEFWARSGIEVLAVPLIITVFAAHLLRRSGDADEPSSDELDLEAAPVSFDPGLG